MKFHFLLGIKARIEVRINRNQFTGKFTYSENGAIKIIRSPGDTGTHFPTENPAYYHFSVVVAN